MVIEELCSKANYKRMTVSLSYDEVRDIANGLYWLGESNSPEKEKYEEISKKCKFLFDMIKHGFIQPETISKFTSEQVHNTKTANEDTTLKSPNSSFEAATESFESFTDEEID